MNNSQKKLHVVFALRSCGELGVFRSVLRAFSEHGHRISVFFDRSLSKEYILEDIRRENMCAGVSYDWALPSERRGTFLFHTRELLSFRRYLFAKQDPYYGERWRRYLHPMFAFFFGNVVTKLLLRSYPVGFFLRLFEKFAPPNKNILEHLKKLSPDVVLVSPTNMRFSSAELEYLKAAKAIRIPAILPVLSWDNLTNKGLMHVTPDLLLAWNETQRAEAVKYHRIPRERIKITGAPYFDSWFLKSKPSQTREEFCKKHGLDPRHLFFLYFGSSIAGADDESWLVEKIRHALDASSDERLRNSSVVVRPHPTHFQIYGRIASKSGIKIIPGEGEMPDTPGRFQLFYDTLYHSAAVMEGANTSAIIEVMILEKPVIIVIEEGHRQEKVEHFQQLIKEDVVDFSRTPEEIQASLLDVIQGRDTRKEARERYIGHYIRPRGLTKSAGGAVVEEVENFIDSRKM